MGEGHVQSLVDHGGSVEARTPPWLLRPRRQIPKHKTGSAGKLQPGPLRAVRSKNYSESIRSSASPAWSPTTQGSFDVPGRQRLCWAAALGWAWLLLQGVLVAFIRPTC